MTPAVTVWKKPRSLGLAILIPAAAASAFLSLRLSTGTDAFRRHPGFAQHPVYRTAMETAQSGNYAGATEAFGKLADREPRSELGAWARFQQAIGYRALKRTVEARAAFERVRTEYPGFFLAAKAGEALQALGKEAGDAEHEATDKGQADCGPRALLPVCETLRVKTTLPELREKAGTTASGSTLEGLAKAAKALGLKAAGVQMDRNELLNLKSPAVAWVDGAHYLAILNVRGDRATVRDPNREREEEMTIAELQRRSGGILLVLSVPSSRSQVSGLGSR